MLTPPFPTLDDLLAMMGAAGRWLAGSGACEGAAGNLSVCLRWPVDPRPRFPQAEPITLPQPVPELAGATLLVSGSGARLGEIGDDPAAHIACIVVAAGGEGGTLYTADNRRFARVTSEFNSHLAVHHDQILRTGTNFHALVHVQPVHLTYLSHIPRYQDGAYLNARLLRWQPETILNLPEGIGVIPFQVPGSAALMAGSVAGMRRQRLVVWAKHGVLARSGESLGRAADLVEYAEAAAGYEVLDLRLGGIGEGLSREEILAICAANGVEQEIF